MTATSPSSPTLNVELVSSRQRAEMIFDQQKKPLIMIVAISKDRAAKSILFSVL
jgi:hypothetical protein